MTGSDSKMKNPDEIKKAKARERQARHRAKQSEEAKAKRNATERQRIARRRQEMDEDLEAEDREAARQRMARHREQTTEAERAKRNKTERLRIARHREEMDEEETVVDRKAARQRMERIRQEMDEDEAAEDREAARQRMAKHRGDMLEDEAAEARERDRQRKEIKRNLNNTKIKPKDGLRSPDILNGTLIVPLLVDSNDDIGKMDVQCQHCGAFKFKKESPGFCCSNGKVLPRVFPRPPQKLMELWKGLGRTQRLFRKHARELNNALCLSSIQVRQKTMENFSPSVIFQGQMKQFAGALLPNEGEIPVFAQLYCFDPALETTQRFENLVIPGTLSITQKEELRKVLKTLQDLLHKHNPFIQDFKMIMELGDNIAEGKIVISAQEKPTEEHSRRYNAPTNFNEVSILTSESRHDLVLHKRGGGLQTISDLNPKGMPLHFSLLFPEGTYGWNPQDKHTDGKRRITSREFYHFHLQIRNNSNENYLHMAERLFQEFILMGWVSTESQRLLYQSLNQKALRADSYKSVREATEERIWEAGARADQIHGDDHHQQPAIGRKILASSFVGSPRWYNAKFQDGMAICRKFHKPDYFITMTCNPSWIEIKRELLEGQTAQDRPDIVSRVFRLKMLQLINDIVKGELFGKVEAYLFTVEWQKRGLPHIHLLIILTSYARNMTPQFVDNIISAELPPSPEDAENAKDKDQRIRLQDLVVNNMLHGPCGEAKPNAPCMENGRCSKSFPKDFIQSTVVDPNGSYATYRRRKPENGGRSVQHNGRTIDNRWVVPYNPYLTLRYSCHINVEATASPKAVKYLFKYIHKGNDRAMVSTRVEGQPVDEIAEFLDLRSVSSGEAYWHLAGFPISDRDPAVLPMRVHLKDQQQIVWDEESEVEALENQRETELTAFFEFNQLNHGTNPAELPKYVDMPECQVWDKSKKKWKTRKQNIGRVIGRVHSVNPVAGEVYYLRMLLHDNHCRGKRSFEDMLTLNDGRVLETFKQVCLELGLLTDDQEWRRALEEAAVTNMCPQIREMFVIILMFCFPSEPATLFDEFWDTWFDDFQLKSQRRGIHLSEDQLKTMVLLDLEQRLSSFERSLEYFHLPTPTPEEIARVEHVTSTQPAVIREELDYEFEDLQKQIEDCIPKFTQEQSKVFNIIMEAVRNETPLQVFLSARGGCGKTFLLNALLAAVRTLEPGGCVALAMATTGIAATLLKLGRTFHSRVKAPLTAHKDSTLNVSAQSHLASLIRMAKLFLIDEATMLDKFLLEAFDRTLRDLMRKPNQPFGGKIVILAGDFRQCLPVVPKAKRAAIVSHCINQSFLWKSFKILTLTQNMRVMASGDRELEDFDKWTLSVGNGESDILKIPDQMIATVIKPNSKENPHAEDEAMHDFCEKIFPDLLQNITDRNFIEGRALLAATNHEVKLLNEHLSSKLPGSPDVLRSADQLQNPQDALRFNVEYLNTLNPNGFPPHTLFLKPGMPLMLLRNLNPKEGLCNGTKLIYERTIDRKILQCKLYGTERTVFIPRIALIPKEGEYPFHWSRLQFPVKVAFAMTINKAQGRH